MKQKLNSLKNILLKKKAILFLSLFIFSIFLLWPIANAHSYYYSLSAMAGNLFGGNKCSSITFSWTPKGGSAEALAVRKNEKPTPVSFNWSSYITTKDNPDVLDDSVISWTNATENSTYYAIIFNWAGLQRSNTVTVKTEPCCTDHCSPSGKKQCTDNTHYVQCGNYDSDPCLEWSSTMSCPSGQTCSGGVCSAPTPTCSNDPGCDQWGKKKCSDNTHYTTCANYDADSCLDWDPTPDACPSGQTCSGAGVCGTPTPTCDSVACNQKDTCKNIDILIDYYCSGTNCLSKEVNCTANEYYYCKGNDVYFHDWRCWTGKCEINPGGDFYVKTCPSGCEEGQCKGAPTCKPECDSSGIKRCTSDNAGYQTCGDYDGDGCLEWSSASSCPSGQTCSGGNCSSPPAEVTLNVPLYNQGSYGNEYYVLESNQRKPNYAYNCGGASSLISNTGCFPTSAAMVLDYYGKNMGVVNTVNSCTDNGCHLINGNCSDQNRPYYSLGSEPYCSAVFEAAGLGSYFIWNKENGGAPFRAEDLFQITDAVATGFPVIVNVSPYYSFAHAMVIKGYKINAQGNVILYVNDPNGGLWTTITDPSLIQLGQVIYP